MKRLSKNFLSIIGSDIARRFLGFVAVAYLAHKLGTAGFGLINIGFTVLSYAILASSAGLVSFGAREVARGNIDELANRIVSLRFFLTLPIFLVVVSLSWLFVHDTSTVKVISYFCLSMFAFAVLLDWYFQGKEEMGILGIARTVSAGVYLLFIFLFVRTSDDIIWVALGALAGDSLAAVLLLTRYNRRFGRVRLRFEPKEWKLLIGRSLPLGAGGILGSLTVNLAPLVIGILMTNSDVGIYSAASKLVFFLLMLDRVLGTLLLPAATRFHANSPETLTVKLETASKWIIRVALPVSLGGTMLSNKIVPFIFGNQYSDAVIVFQVLIWYFFFTLLHTVFTSGLVAIGQEKIYSRIMFVSALVYLVSTVTLTKLFGLIGAAAGMAGSEALTLVFMQLQFRKFVKVPLIRHILKVIPAAFIMGIIVFLLSPMHLLIVIIAGGVVYCVGLFMTHAITKSDLQELLEQV